MPAFRSWLVLNNLTSLSSRHATCEPPRPYPRPPHHPFFPIAIDLKSHSTTSQSSSSPIQTVSRLPGTHPSISKTHNPSINPQVAPFSSDDVLTHCSHAKWGPSLTHPLPPPPDLNLSNPRASRLPYRRLSVDVGLRVRYRSQLLRKPPPSDVVKNVGNSDLENVIASSRSLDDRAACGCMWIVLGI